MYTEEVRKLSESDLRETRQLKIRNRKKANHQIPEVGSVVNADFSRQFLQFNKGFPYN